MLVGTPLMMEYVVQPGDTLWEIAERHDTTVTRLVEENRLDASGDHVMAGQTLSIPAAHGRERSRGDRGTARSSGISPDARRIVSYTVRPGDTPSGLAVRFHAWTAELVEMNGSVLRAGERIRIPVVLAAVAAASERAGAGQSDSERSHRAAGAPSWERPHRTQRAQSRPDAGDDPSRANVRRVIENTARRHGVDPHLALAISWQEAGWRMHHVSYADAVGAMQVIPSTGRWMSDVVGRRLTLTDTHDNVTAGVALLEILTQAAPERQAIAGYYQGLAGVRRHGMYPDTKRYVANVLALKRRFEQGYYPA